MRLGGSSITWGVYGIKRALWNEIELLPTVAMFVCENVTGPTVSWQE
jgi:hypothetical protein